MEEKKSIKVSLGTVICMFIILILVFALITVYYFGFIKNDGENTEKEINTNINIDKDAEIEDNITNIEDEKDTQINNEKDDIYGYALMSYMPADGSFKEFYRIVELHKNSADIILAKYDVMKRDSVDKPNRIYGMKIINNKLYYQLHYSSTESGILTYNNIMCIDLASNDKLPIEILNWKKDENHYNDTIRDYKITDNNIYFNTLNYDYYKYNINSKESMAITETEYNSIIEKNDNYNTDIDELYVDGKKVSVDKVNKELLYDSKIVYSSKEGPIELLYSFDNKIVISEAYNCTEVSCDIRYYEYDVENNTMKQIDFASNQLYGTEVYYK